MTELKMGLVLSGGGAKGAYQVGVVKALIEMGAQVDAIAGASIGALNGAILASAPSFREGGHRMEKLWRTLAQSPPLMVNIPPYLILLVASGLRLNGLDYITRKVNMATSAFDKLTSALPRQARYFVDWLNIKTQITSWLNHGLLSDSPIKELMDQYLDIDGLSNGLPLYVSTFRSRGAIEDIVCCTIAELGLIDTPKSEFLHVQNLPVEQQKEALLSSAAIPLLFSPKEMNNTLYTDGGQGGWQKLQGNTPITPLLENGYKTLIVTHLVDGSLWSRHDFPDATILEIRPQKNISREGIIPDILAFNPSTITSWIDQGYNDTIHCIERVRRPLLARQSLKEFENLLDKQELTMKDSEEKMQAAIHRLQNSPTV